MAADVRADRRWGLSGAGRVRGSAHLGIGAVLLLVSLLGAGVLAGVVGANAPPPRAQSVGPISEPADRTVAGSGAAGLTLSIIGNLAVGSGLPPPVYDPVNGYVYAAGVRPGGDTGGGPPSDGLVTVVSGLASVARLPVGGVPTQLALDTQNGYLYVAGNGTANDTPITVISGTSILAAIPDTPCAVGAAYDPADGFVYVASCRGNVTVVNGTAVAGAIALPVGSCPNGVGYDPELGDAYVSDACRNVLDLLNGTAADGDIGVAGGPFPGAFDPSNGLLYIPCEDSPGVVSVVEGTSTIATVTVGINPISATYDSANGLIYVPNQGMGDAGGVANLTLINGTTRAAVVYAGPYPSSNVAVSVQYANGSGYVFPTDGGPLVAIAGKSVAATLPIPGGAVGLAFDPEDQYLYITSYPNAGADTTNLSIVACTSCLAVTIAEVGSPDGASWGLTASEPSTWFAEQATAAAPATITLHLVAGTYALGLIAAPGTSIRVLAGEADLLDAGGRIQVGPATPPSGGRAAPLGLDALRGWVLAAGSAALASGAVVALVAMRRRNRDAAELIEGMNRAIADDPAAAGRLLR